MFNLGDMMGKIQEMQSRLKEIKEQLDDITVESEAGGGMVRVTANANRKVLKIKLDPDIIDKDDPEIMEDLIAAAVNKVMQVLALDLEDDGVIVSMLHPGRVRTDMGGERADIAPQDSAAGLFDVISSLELKDTGRCLTFICSVYIRWRCRYENW